MDLRTSSAHATLFGSSTPLDPAARARRGVRWAVLAVAFTLCALLFGRDSEVPAWLLRDPRRILGAVVLALVVVASAAATRVVGPLLPLPSTAMGWVALLLLGLLGGTLGRVGGLPPVPGSLAKGVLRLMTLEGIAVLLVAASRSLQAAWAALVGLVEERFGVQVRTEMAGETERDGEHPVFVDVAVALGVIGLPAVAAFVWLLIKAFGDGAASAGLEVSAFGIQLLWGVLLTALIADSWREPPRSPPDPGS